MPGENVNYSRGISEHTYEEKRTVWPYYSWLTGLPTTEGGHDHRILFFKKTQMLVSADWVYNRAYTNGYLNGTNLYFYNQCLYPFSLIFTKHDLIHVHSNNCCNFILKEQ